MKKSLIVFFLNLFLVSNFYDFAHSLAPTSLGQKQASPIFPIGQADIDVKTPSLKKSPFFSDRFKMLGLLKGAFFILGTVLTFSILFLFNTGAPFYIIFLFFLILLPFLIKKPPSLDKLYAGLMFLGGGVLLSFYFLYGDQFFIFLGISLMSVAVLVYLEYRRVLHYKTALSDLENDADVESIRKQFVLESLASLPSNGVHSGVQKVLQFLFTGLLFSSLSVFPMEIMFLFFILGSFLVFFKKTSKQIPFAVLFFFGVGLVTYSLFVNQYILYLFLGGLLSLITFYFFMTEQVRKHLLIDQFKSKEDHLLDNVFDKKNRLSSTKLRRMEVFHFESLRFLFETLLLVCTVIFFLSYPEGFLFFFLIVGMTALLLFICHISKQKVFYVIPLLCAIFLMLLPMIPHIGMTLYNFGVPFIELLFYDMLCPLLAMMIFAMTGVFYCHQDKNSFVPLVTESRQSDAVVETLLRKEKDSGLKSKGFARRKSQLISALIPLFYSLLVAAFLAGFSYNVYLTSIAMGVLLLALLLNFFLERYTKIVPKLIVLLSLVMGGGLFILGFISAVYAYLFVGVAFSSFGILFMLYLYQYGGRIFSSQVGSVKRNQSDRINESVFNNDKRPFGVSSGVGPTLLLVAEAIFSLSVYLVLLLFVNGTLSLDLFLVIFLSTAFLILIFNVLFYDRVSFFKRKQPENLHLNNPETPLQEGENPDQPQNDGTLLDSIPLSQDDTASSVLSFEDFDSNNYVGGGLWATNTERLGSPNHKILIYKFSPVVDGQMLHYPNALGFEDYEEILSVAEVFELYPNLWDFMVERPNITEEQLLSLLTKELKERAFERKKTIFLIGTIRFDAQKVGKEKILFDNKKEIQEIEKLLQNRLNYYEEAEVHTPSLKMHFVQLDSHNGYKAPFLNALKMITEMIKNKDNSDIIFFPELSLTGFSGKDFFDNPEMINETARAKELIIDVSQRLNIAVGFGLPLKNQEISDEKGGKAHRNSYMIHVPEESVFAKKQGISGKTYVQNKVLLPTYDEQEEYRWFEPGEVEDIKNIGKNIPMGLSICEDSWNNKMVFKTGRIYKNCPIEKNITNGCQFLLNISASPYYNKKFNRSTYTNLSKVAKFYEVPWFYLDVAGEQSSGLFGGHSFVINAKGELVKLFQFFREDSETIDLQKMNTMNPDVETSEDFSKHIYGGTDQKRGYKEMSELEDVIVQFLKGYARKNGMCLSVPKELELLDFYKDDLLQLECYKPLKRAVNRFSERSKNVDQRFLLIFDGSPSSFLIASLFQKSFAEDVVLYALYKPSKNNFFALDTQRDISFLRKAGFNVIEDDFDQFSVSSHSLNREKIVTISPHNFTDFMLGDMPFDGSHFPLLQSLSSSDVMALLNHLGVDCRMNLTKEELFWNALRDDFLEIISSTKQRAYEEVIEKTYPLFLKALGQYKLADKEELSSLRPDSKAGKFFHAFKRSLGVILKNFKGEDSTRQLTKRIEDVNKLYLSFLKKIVREVEAVDGSRTNRRAIPMFTSYAPARYISFADMHLEDPDKHLDELWSTYQKEVIPNLSRELLRSA